MNANIPFRLTQHSVRIADINRLFFSNAPRAAKTCRPMQNFARSAANSLTKNHSPGNVRNAGQKTCRILFSATSAAKNFSNQIPQSVFRNLNLLCGK
jgi:DNA-binding NtrC family response regulator